MPRMNVRPPRRNEGQEAAHAGMGAGMVLIIAVGVIILLALAWMLIQPVFAAHNTVAVRPAAALALDTLASFVS